MGACVSTRIISSGEQLGVIQPGGEFDVVQGPARVREYRRQFHTMEQRVANQNEYLHIVSLSGEETFMKGPTSVYQNPTVHHSVTVRDLFTVPSGQRGAMWDDGRIEIIEGPDQVMPGKRVVRLLRKYTLAANEYILATKQTGETEVMEGPRVLYEDPDVYQKMEVKDVVVIAENQRVQMREHDGTRCVVDGPGRIVPGDRSVELLPQYTAKDTQYLGVVFRNGDVEYLPGPITMFLDPTIHQSIDLHEIVAVQAGHRVALWEENGACTLVDGPTNIVPGSRKVTPLKVHQADAQQYLVVKFQAGHAEHLPGPVSLFFDPVLHTSVEVCSVITVNSGEILVVYQKEPANSFDAPDPPPTTATDCPDTGPTAPPLPPRAHVRTARRRFIRGPTVYVPAADEWLHEFVWHGRDDNDPGGKVPGALRFHKLEDTPGQFYYNIRDVRTADDALLECKVMVFFELVDLQKMLDSTVDPIGDFINALAADIVCFATALPYEVFVEKTGTLNDLVNYPNLVDRAQNIGYNINKVVYRGYEASRQLQKMHNESIEKRTQLRLDGETEEKQQEMEDLKLQKDIDRSLNRQELETAEQTHQVSMLKKKHEERVRQTEVEGDMKISLAEKTRQGELEYYHKLREMGLDVTQYLVAKEKQPPSKVIQFTGGK